MESFLGKWKVVLDRCSGIADIGKAFGWSEETATTMASLEYTMTIEADGAGFKCTLDYGVKTLEFSFKLGESFDYKGASGNDAKCVVTEEGGKLVESYSTAEGVSWTTERSLVGGEMNTVTTVGGTDAKCVQILVKA